MSETCTHDCSTCTANCSSRPSDPQSFLEKPHEMSDIKKVIAVVSGKGGVGKSLVTGLLASEMNKKGFRTAILDADITGPSIPKMFGINSKAGASEYGIYPEQSEGGIPVMSVNLLLENETDPVIWRGPVIAGVVKQFWTDVIWGKCDVMFIDMPPGTGDVPLTVFQSIPIDGIVVVTTPQQLVSMVVEKAVNMAKLMNIPVLGLVENMSYVKCPDCGKEINIFGESHVEASAEAMGIPGTGRLPMDPEYTARCDEGKIEKASAPGLEAIMKIISEL